ncbi:MAG: hypothetical protein GMKNLPBB_02202 [Myxococcota bacterium]|nr:hypothetical protein [Myxococcota bacterium]
MERRIGFPAFVCLMVMLTACDSSTTSSDAGGLLPDGAAPADSGPPAGDWAASPERDIFRKGADILSSIMATMAVADSFFAFDPTLDTSKTAEENAAAIQQTITVESKSCAKVSLNGTSVTADFGSGCTLANGMQVAGAATASVGKEGSTITVKLILNGFHVNGKSATGTLVFTTTNGSDFTVQADMTFSGDKVSGTLTIKGANGSFTANGSLSATQAGVPLTIAINNVVWSKGKCYPEAGSVSVTSGRVTITYTFSAQTADTGVVTVTQGRSTNTDTLPAYGSCPVSSADAGAADTGASDGGMLKDAGGLRDR